MNTAIATASSATPRPRYAKVEGVWVELPPLRPATRCSANIGKGGMYRTCGTYLRKNGGGCPDAHRHVAS